MKEFWRKLSLKDFTKDGSVSHMLKAVKDNRLLLCVLSIPFLTEAYVDLFYEFRILDIFQNQVSFFQAESGTPKCTIYQLAFLIILYFIITLSLICRKSKSYIIFIWSVFICIPEILNVFSCYFTGAWLHSDIVSSILNTNLQEALLFAKSYFGFIIIGLSLVLSPIFLRQRSTILSKKFGIYFACLFIWGVIFDELLPVHSVIKAINNYVSDLKDMKEYETKHIPTKGIKSKISANSQIYVLVIGESVDRNHMQIYGYDRETTPQFKSLEKELCVFKDVKTEHVCTSSAVKSMFLVMDKNGKKINLIQFFKDAGFKTFWLSNQGKANLFDNSIYRLANLSDEFMCLDSQDCINVFEIKYYDEELLKYFEKALNDPAEKKFIVMHLIGSHTPVDIRFPQNFNKFKLPTYYDSRLKAEAVRLYDNSIFYTDYVLAKLIHLLKNNEKIKGGVSLFLYLSDHGMDMYDKKECILGARATIHSYEIPFVIWTSNNYQKLNRKFMNSWNLNGQYVTSDLAYSLLDLARLEHESIDLSKSIFSHLTKPEQQKN